MFDIDWLRLISAFITGCLITQSGSLIQGVTQNPLASPATLGFQAVVVLLVLVINSLVGSTHLEYISIFVGLILLALTFIPFKSQKKRDVYSNQVSQNIERYILLGLGINLLVGAIFAIWHFFFMAMNREFPSQIWFGHFRYTNQATMIIMIAAFVILNFFQFRYIRKLQLLSLGEDFFIGLGEDIRLVQKRVVQIVYLQTLIVVSMFGVFSFAALIIPLVLRNFVFFASSTYREVIIGGLAGGVFFSTLDVFCYNVIFYGAELPVGMLSSTIGAIVMVLLLIRQNLKRF